MKVEAKKILHAIEMEFNQDIKVGALEHNGRLVDVVAEVLQEIIETNGVCTCACKVCSMAAHD